MRVLYQYLLTPEYSQLSSSNTDFLNKKIKDIFTVKLVFEKNTLAERYKIVSQSMVLEAKQLIKNFEFTKLYSPESMFSTKQRECISLHYAIGKNTSENPFISFSERVSLAEMEVQLDIYFTGIQIVKELLKPWPLPIEFSVLYNDTRDDTFALTLGSGQLSNGTPLGLTVNTSEVSNRNGTYYMYTTISTMYLNLLSQVFTLDNEESFGDTIYHQNTVPGSKLHGFYTRLLDYLKPIVDKQIDSLISSSPEFAKVFHTFDTSFDSETMRLKCIENMIQILDDVKILLAKQSIRVGDIDAMLTKHADFGKSMQSKPLASYQDIKNNTDIRILCVRIWALVQVRNIFLHQPTKLIFSRDYYSVNIKKLNDLICTLSGIRSAYNEETGVNTVVSLDMLARDQEELNYRIQRIHFKECFNLLENIKLTNISHLPRVRYIDELNNILKLAEKNLLSFNRYHEHKYKFIYVQNPDTPNNPTKTSIDFDFFERLPELLEQMIEIIQIFDELCERIPDTNIKNYFNDYFNPFIRKTVAEKHIIVLPHIEYWKNIIGLMRSLFPGSDGTADSAKTLRKNKENMMQVIQKAFPNNYEGYNNWTQIQVLKNLKHIFYSDISYKVLVAIAVVWLYYNNKDKRVYFFFNGKLNTIKSLTQKLLYIFIKRNSR